MVTHSALSSCSLALLLLRYKFPETISPVLTKVHSTNLETSGYKSVKLDAAGSWEEFSQLPVQKCRLLKTTNHAVNRYTVPQFPLDSAVYGYSSCYSAAS